MKRAQVIGISVAVAAGVMAAGRGGALRLSCHLYTTEPDVDRAVEVLTSR